MKLLLVTFDGMHSQISDSCNMFAIHIHVHACAHVCVRVHARVYASVCVYVCVHPHVCMCMQTHMMYSNSLNGTTGKYAIHINQTIFKFGHY